MVPPTEKPSESPPNYAKLWFFLLLVLVAVVLGRLARTNTTERPFGSPDSTESVELLRRSPEAPDESIEVGWRPGLTVLDATRAAGLVNPSIWATRWRGVGPMAFLEELGGITNQGMDGLNWQFEVNGEYAERGAGATPLRRDDRVLWKLAPYE